MIFNYIKIALRNLIQQRGYTFINIFGLAVGIASSILIILYVVDELSYDTFHPNAENLHRVVLDAKIQDMEINWPISCVPIGPTSVEEYPDIVNYCRIYTFSGEPVIRHKERAFVESRVYFVDSTFFDVFNGFKLLEGDANRILTLPNQMVMTASTAKRYFGNESPMGQVVYYGNERTPYHIMGVVADPPHNSHIQFDILCSMVTFPIDRNATWTSNNFFTYLLFSNGLTLKEANDRMREMTRRYAGPELTEFTSQDPDQFEGQGNRYNYYVQPFLNIHLKSNLNFEMHSSGNLTMTYIFLLIAIFILVIAAINYMNLATARSSKRAREVGVRKVLGSTRERLAGQFLSESIIVALVSLVIALLLLEIAIPWFNNVANKELSILDLPIPITLSIMLATIVLIGLGAGSYPALYLASFQPASVIKGKLREGFGNGTLRGALVVIQFTIAVGLIVSTLVVTWQMRHVRNTDLGFKPDNILVVRRGFAVPEEQRQSFRDELSKLPNVLSVASSTALPSMTMSNNAMLRKGDSPDRTNSMNLLFADWGFQETLGLRMVEGHCFDPNLPRDTMAIVLNQAAAKAFGFTDSPIGEIINTDLGQGERTIVGVVENFHYESLRTRIEPLVIIFAPTTNYISLKLGNGDAQVTIQQVREKWNQFVPDQAFDYFFLQHELDNQYGNERRMAQLFTIFSILAIIIASLGLLGLASYSTEQRVREIGIRKVMGSTEEKVVWLLLKEINRLFLIATLIAWPLAWWLMSRWLENFANSISLSPLFFITASVFAYLMAVLTVGFLALKAAGTNPAITLKYE